MSHTGASGLGAGLTSGNDGADGTIVNGSFTASGGGVTLTSPANITSDCVLWIR